QLCRHCLSRNRLPSVTPGYRGRLQWGRIRTLAKKTVSGMSFNETPRVSVIIPCHNHATYLPEAIESALAQDYPSTEVIVVDDGSTDESCAIANCYGARVAVFQQGNKGLAAARNAGIRAASGEFILCLDADDRILPAFCKSTAPVLVDNPHVGIVATGWRVFGERNYTVVPRAPSFVEQLAINSICCSSLFRRSDWERVGGFDESMHDGFEDWDLWIRIRSGGRELYVVPEVLFEYRRKVSSMVAESFHRSEEIVRFLHAKHADLYVKHFDEIHIVLLSIYHKVRTLWTRGEIVEKNGWKDMVPARVKYLAKALLPNSVVEYIASI
ncbi:MAG: glycosyltransferase family A protein, partial [Verrucomicrobia bacterium]|nr:glycosyltransferase family A protein [Verrucomicrobiota bacterium]